MSRIGRNNTLDILNPICYLGDMKNESAATVIFDTSTINDQATLAVFRAIKGVKGVRFTTPPLDRLVVLQDIFEYFQGMTQWIPANPDHMVDDAAKAEALIQLLEAFDCGSHGGYDIANPKVHTTNYDLYNRFLTVLRKHNTAADIQDCCSFTVKTLGDYFVELEDLRRVVSSRPAPKPTAKSSKECWKTADGRIHLVEPDANCRLSYEHLTGLAAAKAMAKPTKWRKATLVELKGGVGK